MYKKTILKPFLFLASTALASQLNAATIGTYTFEDNAIADQLLAAQGQMYDGTNWLYAGTDSSWSIYDSTSGWTNTSAPSDATDVNVSTFLAATQNSGSVSLDLGFSQTSAINGDGDDLAFFFLWDQTANNANISINGTTQQLTFSDVFDDAGVAQVATTVNWNGTINSNVKIVAASIDLSDFGLSLGAALNSPVALDLTSSTSAAMALSLTAALNSSTSPVPIPAAIWLFGTGLIALTGIARRKV